MKLRMKKLLILSLSLSSVLTAYAQPRPVPRTQEQETEISSIGRPADRTAGMPAGIARINGVLYYITNNQATLATPPLRVGNELNLESNGSVILSDGRRVNLREGQMVTVAGTLTDAPRGVELPRPIRPDSRRVVRRPIPRTDAAPTRDAGARTRRNER
jgi:hypothetical protein